MAFRPKLFLTFAALCTAPLLILSLISFRSGMKNAEALVRDNVDDEVREVAHHYATLVAERGRELTTLARGPLRAYVRSARTADSAASIDRAQGSVASGTAVEAANAAREAIENLPADYADIACFDADKHLMFLSHANGAQTVRAFRTKDFLPGTMEPDEGVWYRKTDSSPRCSIVSHPTFGNVRRCSVPIFLTPQQDPALRGVHDPTSPRGVLVADMRLDELLLETGLGGGFFSREDTTRRVIVLDSSGKIVYHQNEALRHQPISSAMPGFARIAEAMVARHDWGTGEFSSAEGETWFAAYSPIEPGLSLAVTRNYSQATQPARQAGWLGIALSIVLGLGTATLLTAIFQKKTQRLERVSESVAAIAGGNLDERVEARSSDDLRLLADNVNVMTERLREQLAREAEARQFESFVKLSALLTHDLKNAIEGLSLLVGNMERHFDNPRFRADAMKALTSAADKLRGLVARLSNPVNTLSGEFKLPRPTDLVPLLRRVLAQIADPVRHMHEIEIRLPPSLIALADSERMEKVMENLVLNAVEAMSGKSGKLTVEAGPLSDAKVFFSISDTGPGMSPEFIQQRLFRPFATTKSRGVGLGLYTCREVVRASAGSIEVDSSEGSGTTFRVVLASARIKQRD